MTELNQSNDSPGQDKNCDENDVRSPIAIGYAWATIIISLGFELVIPVLSGIYVDYKLGTRCIFLLAGIFLGFLVATVNFFKLLKSNKLRYSGKTTSSAKHHRNDS